MNYQLMWKTLAGPPEELGDRLEAFSDAELKVVCATYVDARTELVDALVRSGRSHGASEDVLDDLAEWLLMQGEATFEKRMFLQLALPARPSWGQLGRSLPSAAMGRTLRLRLKTDLLTVYDDVIAGS